MDKTIATKGMDGKPLDKTGPMWDILGTIKALKGNLMSREDQANKRSNSIRVRLVPEMLDRFEVISRGFGMAPSTLAAYVIGAFVRDQEKHELREQSVPLSVLGGLLAKDSD